MAFDIIIMSLLAIAPISEVRGAIIYGMGMNINPFVVLALSASLNVGIIPLIFIALSKARFLALAKRLFGRRAYAQIEKNKPWIDKWGVWALLPFVAVPLPMTGAWTAAFIAVLLDINKKRAFITISIGVLIAALIVYSSIAGLIHIWDVIK